MIGLDTNVLVRYLTQDDLLQAAKASQLLEKKGETFFINQIVLCELIWVLESAYATPKEEIIQTLEKILATAEFEIEQKTIVFQALEDFKKGPADFSDYLIGRKNLSVDCDYTATFDRQILKAKGFKSPD